LAYAKAIFHPPRTFVTSADLEHPSLQELGSEAAVYADAAYVSRARRKKLERFGIDDQAQRKGYRGHPILDANSAKNLTF